jgi:hypothetical protein
MIFAAISINSDQQGRIYSTLPWPRTVPLAE